MEVNLAEVRILRGKTQKKMAELLEIGISTYNVYENGQRKIPEEIATKICKILDQKMESLFLPATFTLSKTTKVKIKNEEITLS